MFGKPFFFVPIVSIMLILLPIEHAYRYVTVSDYSSAEAVVINKVTRKSWRRSGQNKRRYFVVKYYVTDVNGDPLKVVARMSATSTNYAHYAKGDAIWAYYFPESPTKPFYTPTRPMQAFIMVMVGGAVTFLWAWWYFLIYRRGKLPKDSG